MLGSSLFSILPFKTMCFRKPELIPLLFLFGTVTLTSGLGIWQVQRLQWKNALIARIEAAQAQPPLTQLPASAEDLEFRRIALQGRFLFDKELHLGAKYHEKQVGYHLLTPFAPTGHKDATLLVDRGWVPADKKEPGKRPKSVIQKSTQVIAVLLTPEKKRLFSPDNAPDRNLWFYEDIPVMEQATGLPLYPLVAVEVGQAEKDVLPIPGEGRFILRNDHLSYAITWFSLSLIALVMFVLYHRVPEEKA